jgi:hypothetical protein
MDVVDILRSLHDGYLVAISLQSRTVVRLKCAPLGKVSVVFEVSGVRDLCANNFRQGNIILSAEIRTSVEQLDGLAIRGLAHSEAEDDIASYIRRMRESEVTDSIRYLVLQCSYGCDLAVAYEGGISVVDSI